jgi:hypothetical protein
VVRVRVEERAYTNLSARAVLSCSRSIQDIDLTLVELGYRPGSRRSLLGPLAFFSVVVGATSFKSRGTSILLGIDCWMV